MFYAVGYTNNGANEKKLGPFTTKEEAMKAGRSEAGITRGFSFSGVVDDSGNYVYHNSRACNSTNPVVANAMRARNATYQYHDYDVPVIQLGQRKYITIRGVADEETAKALARSSPGITIDESRKVKVKNASGGVARNSEEPSGYEEGAYNYIYSAYKNANDTLARIKKALSLWRQADASQYPKGTVEKAKRKDVDIISFLESAIISLKKALDAAQ